MNDHAGSRLAFDRDASERPVTVPEGRPHGKYRRAAKVVGDLLWWSFLTVIFGSITIGVATELLF